MAWQNNYLSISTFGLPKQMQFSGFSNKNDNIILKGKHELGVGHHHGMTFSN
jgi:hypothetical protein